MNKHFFVFPTLDYKSVLGLRLNVLFGLGFHSFKQQRKIQGPLPINLNALIEVAY